MRYLLDDVARTLAGPMPRRQALRLLGGALAGGILGVLGVKQAGAQQNERDRGDRCGGTTCTRSQKCCNNSFCIPSTGVCCGTSATSSCTGTQKCCTTGPTPFCIPGSGVCCGASAGTSCASGRKCCPGSNFCAQNNDICCGTTSCNGNRVCCNSVCCGNNQVCCGGVCCNEDRCRHGVCQASKVGPRN